MTWSLSARSPESIPSTKEVISIQEWRGKPDATLQDYIGLASAQWTHVKNSPMLTPLHPVDAQRSLGEPSEMHKQKGFLDNEAPALYHPISLPNKSWFLPSSLHHVLTGKKTLITFLLADRADNALSSARINIDTRTSSRAEVTRLRRRPRNQWRRCMCNR